MGKRGKGVGKKKKGKGKFETPNRPSEDLPDSGNYCHRHGEAEPCTGPDAWPPEYTRRASPNYLTGAGWKGASLCLLVHQFANAVSHHQRLILVGQSVFPPSPRASAFTSHLNISPFFVENKRPPSNHPFSPFYNGAGMTLSSIQPPPPQWRRKPKNTKRTHFSS